MPEIKQQKGKVTTSRSTRLTSTTKEGQNNPTQGREKEQKEQKEKDKIQILQRLDSKTINKNSQEPGNSKVIGEMSKKAFVSNKIQNNTNEKLESKLNEGIKEMKDKSPNKTNQNKEREHSANESQTQKTHEEGSNPVPETYERINTIPHRLENRYSLGTAGPFYVIAQQMDNKDNPTRDNERISLASVLVKKNFNAHTNINKQGDSKFKIEAISAEEANRLVEGQFLAGMGYELYIPYSLIKTDAIIKGIPRNIEEEEIWDNIESSVPIEHIKRLLRRSFSENGTVEKTTNVKITFQGRDIPEYVKLFKVKLKVDYFIPSVRKCTNCLRYGHTAAGCGRTKRCTNCGEENCNTECKNASKCASCKGGHPTFHRECEEWLLQAEIQKLMTIGKIGRREAINILTETSENSEKVDQVPISLDSINFPPLEENDTTLAKIRNHATDASKIIYRSKTVKLKKKTREKEKEKTTPKKRRNSTETVATTPIYEHPLYFKVSEYEKTINELIRTMERAYREGLIISKEEIAIFKKRNNLQNIQSDLDFINSVITDAK